MAFSLFGKKDEPEKKEPAKKPAAGATPAKPAGAAAPAAKPAAKPVVQESVPVGGEDLDFTDLFDDPKPATPGKAEAAPAAAKPGAPAKPAAPAPSGGDLPFSMDDLVASVSTPQPAEKPAAPPPKAAAPAAPPKAAPAAAAPAPAAPAAAAPAPAAAPAKAGLKVEHGFTPGARPAEKPAAPKAPGGEPARPRASASAGPAAPPNLTPAAAKPAAPAAPVTAEAKPAPAPAAAPAAPKPAPAPKVEVAAAAPAAKKPESEQTPALPNSLQQAAVMFANGQIDNATSGLKGAIATGGLGDFAAQGWLMLFDIYQAQAQKQQHDELALQFVVKFERSAPTWRVESKEGQDASTTRGMGSYFALTGELSKASEPEFEKLQKVAGKGSLLRLDFGKLKGVDEVGAQMLLTVLKDLVKAKRELVLTSHGTLVDLISSHLEVGNKDNPQPYWLLLLELYQILGLQNEFDDAAVNFAITYEVSPPAFEVPAKPAKAEVASPVVADTGDDAIALAGEICGSDDEELTRLVTSAALRQQVVIDMAQVKRVDFVAAGAILNAVTALEGSGKSVEFRSASELVSALFQVIGITKHAKLTKRR